MTIMLFSLPANALTFKCTGGTDTKSFAATLEIYSPMHMANVTVLSLSLSEDWPLPKNCQYPKVGKELSGTIENGLIELSTDDTAACGFAFNIDTQGKTPSTLTPKQLDKEQTKDAFLSICKQR